MHEAVIMGKIDDFAKNVKFGEVPFQYNFPSIQMKSGKSFSFQSFPSDQMNIFYLLAAPLINLCSGGYL